jgi:hypothetical protein
MKPRIGLLALVLLMIPMAVVITSVSSESAHNDSIDTHAEGSETPAPAQVSEEGREDTGLSPCGATILANYIRPFSTFEQIAWGSKKVVVGTVIGDHGTYGEVIAPDLDETARQVVTDYEIEVESQLRGEPAETLTVRRSGGRVDDCVVEVHGQENAAFRAGDRFLLFLTEDESENYWPWGPDAIWRIAEDGTIQGTSQFLAIEASPGLTYQEVAIRILDSLRSGNPDERVHSNYIVPLEDAPVLSDRTLQLPES